MSKGKLSSFERLEFLGDRVLGLTIAEALYKKFPSYPEGELTRLYSDLVSRQTCKEIAHSINLENFIIAKQKDDFKRNSIMANALESVLGAVYLDSDFCSTSSVINSLWKTRIDTADTIEENPKVMLQEWCQKKYKIPPTFSLIDQTGSEHNPTFRVAVIVPQSEPYFGEGCTIKQAEKKACQNLLDSLNKNITTIA